MALPGASLAEQLVAALAAHAIELRVGFELHPTRALREDDPSRYRLEGREVVLVECPRHEFSTLSLTDAVLLGEHVEAHGLLPVLAHPGRSREIAADPQTADGLSSRGWLLQVTGGRLLVTYGPLVEAGYARIVASDGHGRRRPPIPRLRIRGRWSSASAGSGRVTV